MSGRQRVDILKGGARWRISQPFLVHQSWRLETRVLARQLQYYSLFKMSGTGWCKTGNILHVYPLSTWRHHTWPYLPSLPPLYLHTTSGQRPEVGTAFDEKTVFIIHSFNYTELVPFLSVSVQTSSVPQPPSGMRRVHLKLELQHYHLSAWCQTCAGIGSTHDVSMLRTDCQPDRFMNGPLVYKLVSRFVIRLACFW